MIYHIINEYSKLVQKEFKTRHDWIREEIHRELCKKMKFDQTIKWYMNKPESENEKNIILSDFEIQTGHLIPARRPDLVIIDEKKKRTCGIVDFAVLVDHRVKRKENDQRDNCNWHAWNDPMGLGKGAERVGNQRTNRGYSDHSIGKISQNTENSLGDLRRIAVTQTTVKDHQLMLVGKTHK